MGESPEARTEEDEGGDGGELSGVRLEEGDGGSVGELESGGDGGSAQGDCDWFEAHVGGGVALAWCRSGRVGRRGVASWWRGWEWLDFCQSRIHRPTHDSNTRLMDRAIVMVATSGGKTSPLNQRGGERPRPSGVDLRPRQSDDELARLASDRIDDQSPRDVAAFWFLSSKFLRSVQRNHSRKSIGMNKQLSYQLQSLLDHAMQSLERFKYRQLTSRLLQTAEEERERGGRQRRIFCKLLLDKNHKPNITICDSFALFSKVADSAIQRKIHITKGVP